MAFAIQRGERPGNPGNMQNDRDRLGKSAGIFKSRSEPASAG